MANPGKAHWLAAKYVLHYLKGTSSFGIEYRNDDSISGYADSNFAREPDQRKSHSGMLFLISGGPICWKSQLQKSTALSALEADYMALCLSTREATWIRQLFDELQLEVLAPIVIYGDNQGCQAISQNRRTDARTKHIDIQYHFTRDKIEDATVLLKYCSTQEMVADSLTKPVDVRKFIWCREAMGIKDVVLRVNVGINPTSSL
jgi:hypothetical protein